MTEAKQILDEAAFSKAIDTIAEQIIERHQGDKVAFVGIHTRGVYLANRLQEKIGTSVDITDRGDIDISLYRDDLDNLGSMPRIKDTNIPFQVDDAQIILCDDVLFTCRTIRAAIDVLIDYGRPSRIELAVLVDRGNRELPISADYTGQRIQTSRTDYISVRFKEADNEDGVYLLENTEES